MSIFVSMLNASVLVAITVIISAKKQDILLSGIDIESLLDTLIVNCYS